MVHLEGVQRRTVPCGTVQHVKEMKYESVKQGGTSTAATSRCVLKLSKV